MDTKTTAAENALPEDEAPRKSGRLPPIVMTSTTNLFQFQSDLKEYVKGEYKFQNARNGSCIKTKEMVDYSTIKFYLEKNNLHYFTFSPNSEKPIRAVIHHLRLDTPVEDISNSLEDLMLQRLQHEATKSPSIPCYLKKKQKSQEIFKPNCINHIIIIEVELYRAQTCVMQCYNCQTLAMSGPSASNPLDVCGVVVATCIENVLKR
jgi:hypothetical protein